MPWERTGSRIGGDRGGAVDMSASLTDDAVGDNVETNISYVRIEPELAVMEEGLALALLHRSCPSRSRPIAPKRWPWSAI